MVDVDVLVIVVVVLEVIPMAVLVWVVVVRVRVDIMIILKVLIPENYVRWYFNISKLLKDVGTVDTLRVCNGGTFFVRCDVFLSGLCSPRNGIRISRGNCRSNRKKAQTCRDSCGYVSCG